MTPCSSTTPSKAGTAHKIRRLLLSLCSAAAMHGLPAGAAPMTLHIEGLFTATNSQSTRNSASANALAQVVNGSSSWNALANVALRLELDYDDVLSVSTPSANAWVWSYTQISALRIQLGNAQFSTQAAAGSSLGKVIVGATSTPTAPELSSGLLLDLLQPWSRSGSPPAYSFAGATPQTSGNALYEHYFRTLYDFSTGNRVLDFWSTLAASDALNGGLPTGRWGLSSFSVSPQQDDTPPDSGNGTPPANGVPEPGTLLLGGLGLSALLAARKRSAQA